MSDLSKMAETLRAAFGQHDRMSDASYNKLCGILDRASDDALRTAYEAQIKFVSTLAFNRMLRRGLVRHA